MASAKEEQAYHDGFMDGLRSLIDAWDDATETSEGRTEAYEGFRKVIEEHRKNLETDAYYSLDS